MQRESTAAPRQTLEQHVWVLSRWICGGGGDDETVIRGVFATAEEAYAASETGDEIAAYPVGRVVQDGEQADV